jgi:putative transposase
MTPARRIRKGTTYLITRRCSERRFFLKPSRRTEAIFPYALALYARRYGVQIHAFCVLSNHYHLVLTDTFGRLPDFQRDFDSLMARATNSALGRWDGFWERDTYSAVELVTASAVQEKLVYLLANPVAAGLVRKASEWPGHWSDPRRIGAPPVTIARPKAFFDEKGHMPRSVEFQLTPPPGFENDAAFVERLVESLSETEESEAVNLANMGRSFMGVARVLAQSFFARPAPGEARRTLNPRVACRNKWKRIEALQRLVEFRAAYREALDAWRAGMRDVLFPPGTWLMRILHAAPCAASG